MIPNRRSLRLAAPVLLLPLCAGCIMPDQLDSLKRDVADVQQQLRGIQREQDEARRRLAEVETTLGEGSDSVTRSEFADLALAAEQTSREVAILDERIRDAGRRLDNLSQDIQGVRSLASRKDTAPTYPGSGGPVGSLEPPGDENPGTAVPRPDDLYNSAYADFSKGNYALAISGFEEYASRYPDSDLADNALYWVGECRFSQGEFASAIQAYDRLLSRYPRTDRAAAAHLKKGLCYMEQNQIGQAIVQLQFVRDNYAGSDESRVARDKLTSLGEGG